MEEKELNFYKLPFYTDDILDWVYDANDNFMFQFHIGGVKEKVVEALNSKERVPNKAELTISPTDNGMILNQGHSFIRIRGWGNLTGVGAHNFSAEKAAKIQDDLRDWIIWKLELNKE